jgi:thioredoxin 1
MAKELNSGNFDAHIKSKLALVDFWAPWCGPCIMFAPVMEQLSLEMKDVAFGKVNVDDESDLAAKYNVSSMPTLILFSKGEIVDRRTGAATKAALKEWIEENKG